MAESSTVESHAARPSKSKGLAIAAILVLALAGGAAYYYFAFMHKIVFERDGVVTFLDPTSRKASMELPDPSGGSMMDVSVERVPDDCKITIDGKPATLAEVRVGDKVHVRVQLEKLKTADGKKEKKFTPLEVNVRRDGA